MKPYKKEKVCTSIKTSWIVTVQRGARELMAGVSVQLPAVASRRSVPTLCKALCQVLAPSVGLEQLPG